MKEYKENEVRKDMFYEEQKREKTQVQRERLEAEKKNKEEQETMNTSVEVTTVMHHTHGGATDGSGNPVRQILCEVSDNSRKKTG